jgi:hypothetical protein
MLLFLARNFPCSPNCRVLGSCWCSRHWPRRWPGKIETPPKFASLVRVLGPTIEAVLKSPNFVSRYGQPRPVLSSLRGLKIIYRLSSGILRGSALESILFGHNIGGRADPLSLFYEANGSVHPLGFLVIRIVTLCKFKFLKLL